MQHRTCGKTPHVRCKVYQSCRIFQAQIEKFAQFHKKIAGNTVKFGIMPKKQIKRITTMQNGNTITIYIIIIAKSFHKCTLTDNKRQGTTSMVIPRLCSFLLTVLRTPSAEPPVNKKRTRTLSRKESGSSTNCLVEN